MALSLAQALVSDGTVLPALTRAAPGMQQAVANSQSPKASAVSSPQQQGARHGGKPACATCGKVAGPGVQLKLCGGCKSVR